MAILRVDGLTKRFGGLTAVDNVSFSVDEGEIVGLIGPNGAGKSTTFNLIMGALSLDAGRIEHRGTRIETMPTHERVRRGLGRTYQTPKQFGEFTVEENIHACMLPNEVTFGIQHDGVSPEAAAIVDRVELTKRATDFPDKLTPGELRRLEIAKALAGDPDILLLDEVFAGITKNEARDLARLIRTLRDEGLTFLIVDHVMDVLMPLVDRNVVLNFGQKIAEGSSEEVVGNETVQEIYLGSSAGVA